MPKLLSDQRIALVALPSAPANPNAITVAEFDAGVRLECRVMDYRLSPTASDTVASAELCSGTNAQAPGRSNYEGTVTVLRYLTAEGLSDPANDVAWDTFKLKGTTLHLVDREGPEHEEEGAAGQEYSYFEVITDNAQKPTDRAGFIRREVPLLVQRAFPDRELVAG